MSMNASSLNARDLSFEFQAVYFVDHQFGLEVCRQCLETWLCNVSRFITYLKKKKKKSNHI